MRIFKKIYNRYFLTVMHSENEILKEKVLRKIVNHLGKGCRIYSDSFGSEPYLLDIGNNVIIASNVKFIEHDASYYTAHRFLNLNASVSGEKMGAIILGDNCFIGADSIILGGTKIGNNSVIAAGSVVHGIVPQEEVWGGTGKIYYDYGRICKKSSKAKRRIAMD